MDSKVNKEDIKFANDLKGDEVVISGISGVFPNSENVVDFMDNLYNKVDMVSDNPRWDLKSSDIPKHLGKVPGMERFDAQFFKIGYQMARVLEPHSRKLLEHTYSAIFDSGTNLTSLKGKKVGVYIGSSFNGVGTQLMFSLAKGSDFIVSGSSKAMLANRISYWMDAKGPSYGLECTCTGSMVCLEQAFNSIKSGECEAAVVGGCSYCIHPVLSGNMRRAGLLCLDGKTKCFDKHGDGYVRAEAMGIVFLQKAKDAKRIYAEVVHAKSTYNMKPDAEFLPIRPPELIQDFLEEFYSEIDVKPGQVEYVEAHGAGIAQADANEIKAITKVFVEDKPVKIGSVKSNMGHAEAASGICSIAKLCLAYQKGKLAPNLHYNDPQDLPAIEDGRVQVVTETTDFNRQFAALNNFSYGGTNCHVLLKGHFKEKDKQKYKSNIPYLVLASGRQDDCVQKVIDLLKDKPLDPELIGLLHNVFKHDIFGHLSRGYLLLDTSNEEETVAIKQSVAPFSGAKRPVWFVFSGVGSHWTGMATNLMKIEAFAATIEKCRKIIEPKGIDLVKVITSDDESLLQNVQNMFVGIGAIQAGLITILDELGIVPDFITGHSLGEMACAYYDKTFTLEEFMLATCSRGEVCVQTPMVKGAMAAVGLPYKSVTSLCPPEIDIACHNSSDSTTISGPADVTKAFVEDLKSRGIFAREVASEGIPYHSRYIGVAGLALVESLKKVIKNQKLRSEKWLSTSVPEDKWDEDLAKYSSPEYHANNMLSPVLFEEITNKIPDDAIVIEIAPHGLLQAILKRSLQNCVHVPLTKRGTSDGVQFVLEAIGKMYEAGLNPKIENLYPKVEYPVSTETPLLSHFVEWEHSEDWSKTSFTVGEECTSMARDVVITTKDDDYTFLKGHLRNGINILPEAQILNSVWETLAMYKNIDYRDLSVEFKDIQFYREVEITNDASIKLSISITKGNNKFEVSYENITIVTGIVNEVRNIKLHHEIDESKFDEDEILLNSDDVYKILDQRGHYYGEEHKSIKTTNLECNKALVNWNNEWVTYLDSLIQFNILASEHEGVSVPKFIGKLRISINELRDANQKATYGQDTHVANIINTYGVTRCAGIEIDSITFTEKVIIEKEPDVLETLAFFPQYLTEKVDIQKAAHVMMQIVKENSNYHDINILKSKSLNTKFSSTFEEVVENESMQIKLDTIDIDKYPTELLIHNDKVAKANLVIVDNVMNDKQKLVKLQEIVSEDTFLLALERKVPKVHLIKEHFNIITCMSDGDKIFILLKRIPLRKHFICIPIKSKQKVPWIKVHEALKRDRVVLISEKQSSRGVLGLVKNLRKEGHYNLSALIIEDVHAPKFDSELPFYKDQLDLNLVANVFKKGQWGSYYYSPSQMSSSISNMILTNKQPGNIDGLTWVEAPLTDNNNVQVWYAGVSLRDCQNAVSCVNNNRSRFGMDFSGINSRGEKIMGAIKEGSLASMVEADPGLTWSVPKYWSLEDAATVPLAYLHAFYCLSIRCDISKGQSVLITGDSGALAQAVVAICLALNCPVYITVRDLRKKRLLLQLFPELAENHIAIWNPRTVNEIPTFNAQRFDIVINLGEGCLRQSLLKYVDNFGTFLDVNKSDMYENKDFCMGYLHGDKCYKGVDLTNIFKPEYAEDKKFLQELVAEGIAKGTVRPLSRVVYQPTAVTKAFKLLASNKQAGKVLIQLKDSTSKLEINVSPRMTFSPNSVYVVICDETYLGFELVDNIIRKGARKVIVNHTSELPGFVYSKFLTWNKYAATVKITSYNLTALDDCKKLVKEGAKIGQIKGVFIVDNSEDKENDNKKDKEDEEINLEWIVSNLDTATGNVCNGLSDFVIISRYSRSDSHEYQMGTVEKIYEARNEIALPGLVVRYDGLDTSTDSDTKIHRSALFDGMEKSLKLNYRNVYIHNSKNKKPSDYIQRFIKILGVKTLDDFDETRQIKEFEIDKIYLEQLKNLIKEIYNINYSIEKIESLTIRSLKNLGVENKRVESSSNAGIETFFTAVDDEQAHISITYPIVSMITLLNRNIERDLDPNNEFITLIPGFDGRHQIFETISETLKVRAVAVNYSADIINHPISIPQMAAEVRKFMKMRFEVKPKFYLLGYSFGVNIALEVAAILEKEGFIGTVFCLDSSPEVLKDQLKSYLSSDENELQNNIIEHIFQLITNQTSPLGYILSTLNTWKDKVDVCVIEIKKYTKYSREYIKKTLDNFYRRIQLAKEYKPDLNLESELVLIKGLPYSSSNLPEDYNLSKYTKKPVKIYQIEQQHATITKDCSVPNIVNSLLDGALLEEYKKKNLCDVYMIKSKQDQEFCA